MDYHMKITETGQTIWRSERGQKGGRRRVGKAVTVARSKAGVEEALQFFLADDKARAERGRLTSV